MKNTKNLKKEVLDNFDFERVHKVMELLEWTWVTKKKEHKIPSVKKMKKHAGELIDNALKGLKKSGLEQYSISTGGFEACAFHGEEGIEVGLRFIVEEF